MSTAKGAARRRHGRERGLAAWGEEKTGRPSKGRRGGMPGGLGRGTRHGGRCRLGLSSVRGRFAEFSGRIDIGASAESSSVVAEIDAASIDTGNSTRDDHLRSADFLDAGPHPTISYRSTGLSPAGPDRWTLHGVLKMSGVTRPIDLDLPYLGTSPDPWGGLRAAFRAVTELRREDFAMTYNQVVQAGISLIGATLKVELDIQAVQGELSPQA
ncbi:YceI family protein [Planotetraspora mira]|uniref:YceI family protein n=1 Tax=Planotetraspora mira TaxID=58121 RepID=UPI001EF21108|nr:YceI family protein [Planotetraspora mira]